MSLAGLHHPLASSAEQLRVLSRPTYDFQTSLKGASLAASHIDVLQVNLGKLCNQTCKHCHVDAGPDRREMMTRETAELCIAALQEGGIRTLDVTGGAPELNANFRWLVTEARRLGVHVIDRSNLTILLLPTQADLGSFLAEHGVEVIASLPYFTEQQTDAQRGAGVFRKSIEAIRVLNSFGYGRPGSGLVLNLVYNPVGAFLPPSQAAIESDFRRELSKRFEICFNRLFTITNMPISRFLEFLIRTGNYERYMERLVNAFNPAAAASVMCRSMISVGWDGMLYDCDFNQQLEMPVACASSAHIRDFRRKLLESRKIVTGPHCYGCTAGSGSSCSGETARQF